GGAAAPAARGPRAPAHGHPRGARGRTSQRAQAGPSCRGVRAVRRGPSPARLRGGRQRRPAERIAAGRPARGPRRPPRAWGAADRRRRAFAEVASAVPLNESQQARLSAVLAGIYGREVQLNLQVDPEVVGGLRIQVGDDLYDATVLARLSRARSSLVA